MCGRFTLTEKDEELIERFEAPPANDLPDTPNFNICPTNQVHAVTSFEGQRQLRAMRWGFLPDWYKTTTDGPLLINARSETIAEKPAFRSAARTRRCLIPANGFYEWTKDEAGQRLPWFIHAANDEPLAFAGVWQNWERNGEMHTTCAIVTTAANTKMATLHHRMPVILAQKDWSLWLGEAGHGAAVLMRATADEALTFWRVDPKVNSNRASGANLTEPISSAATKG